MKNAITTTITNRNTRFIFTFRVNTPRVVEFSDNEILDPCDIPADNDGNYGNEYLIGDETSK